MRRNLLGAAVAAALGMGMPLIGLAPQPGQRRTDRFRRHKPSRTSWRSGWSARVPGGGEQECARRRRQISAGILQRANGLHIDVERVAAPGRARLYIRGAR
jgi:hypothetical protein